MAKILAGHIRRTKLHDVCQSRSAADFRGQRLNDVNLLTSSRRVHGCSSPMFA